MFRSLGPITSNQSGCHEPSSFSASRLHQLCSRSFSGLRIRSADPRDRRTRIEQLMVRLHQKEEFTGEILVADRGHVVFEGAFGTADHGTGRPYTTDTRSCLASLSNHVPRSCDGATTRTARQSCQASSVPHGSTHQAALVISSPAASSPATRLAPSRARRTGADPPCPSAGSPRRPHRFLRSRPSRCPNARLSSSRWNARANKQPLRW